MTEEVGMMQEALVHDNVLVTGWRALNDKKVEIQYVSLVREAKKIDIVGIASGTKSINDEVEKLKQEPNTIVVSFEKAMELMPLTKAVVTLNPYVLEEE